MYLTDASHCVIQLLGAISSNWGPGLTVKKLTVSHVFRVQQAELDFGCGQQQHEMRAGKVKEMREAVNGSLTGSAQKGT